MSETPEYDNPYFEFHVYLEMTELDPDVAIGVQNVKRLVSCAINCIDGRYNQADFSLLIS